MPANGNNIKCYRVNFSEEESSNKTLPVKPIPSTYKSITKFSMTMLLAGVIFMLLQLFLLAEIFSLLTVILIGIGLISLMLNWISLKLKRDGKEKLLISFQEKVDLDMILFSTYQNIKKQLQKLIIKIKSAIVVKQLRFLENGYQNFRFQSLRTSSFKLQASNFKHN